MGPHLTTALTGPLLELEAKFLAAAPTIERWLRSQWQDHTPPFYGSVDLRNAGFKLAPVDMNLFPGGFNNLNSAFLPLCVQAAMTAIEKICPNARSLLLIPENHTRNLFYLQNVAQLVTILRLTGLEVRLGSLLPVIDQPTTVDLPNGTSLLLEPLVRSGNRLGLKDFNPCAVLLNNDLTAGIPDVLRNLEEQYVLPPLHAGWAVRRKSNHFAAYDEVADEFAKLLGPRVHQRLDSAAARVAKHDDVLHAKHAHGVFHGGADAMVARGFLVGRHEVGHVSHHEHVAGFAAGEDGRVHAGVGAGDDQDLGGLAALEVGKKGAAVAEIGALEVLESGQETGNVLHGAGTPGGPWTGAPAW